MARETRTHEFRCEAVTAAENRARKERARSKALRALARQHSAEYHALLTLAEHDEGVVVLQRGPKPGWTQDPARKGAN